MPLLSRSLLGKATASLSLTVFHSPSRDVAIRNQISWNKTPSIIVFLLMFYSKFIPAYKALRVEILRDTSIRNPWKSVSTASEFSLFFFYALWLFHCMTRHTICHSEPVNAFLFFFISLLVSNPRLVVPSRRDGTHVPPPSKEKLSLQLAATITICGEESLVSCES